MAASLHINAAERYCNRALVRHGPEHAPCDLTRKRGRQWATPAQAGHQPRVTPPRTAWRRAWPWRARVAQRGLAAAVGSSTGHWGLRNRRCPAPANSGSASGLGSEQPLTRTACKLRAAELLWPAVEAASSSGWPLDRSLHLTPPCPRLTRFQRGGRRTLLECA